MAERDDPGLRLYSLMSSLPPRRSYRIRLLALCFVGTHVPLLALTLFVLVQAPPMRESWAILGVLLAATLLGTAFTLAGVDAMLRPVRLSTSALQGYLADRTVPRLPEHFTDEAGQLMRAIQGVVAKLEFELRRAERLARTDPLTGLHNRRAFRDFAETSLRKARDGGEPLSLVVVDIDHFKRINDRYGHQVGDDVIVQVGRLLAQAGGAGGHAVRLGGEEFGLLLPRTGGPQAFQLAERLRQNAARLSFPQAGQEAITISVGVASLQPTDQAVEDLLRRADGALYGSKSEGRDRTTSVA